MNQPALRKPYICGSKQYDATLTSSLIKRNLKQLAHMTASQGVKEAPSKEVKIVELPTNEKSDNLLKIRHSSAHIMAMAVQRLFKDAQVTIGPWIENGFYYDFDLKGKTFDEADLKNIRKEMIKIINKNLPITREVGLQRQTFS